MRTGGKRPEKNWSMLWGPDGLKESPIVHMSKDCEQKEEAEAGSVGGASQQGPPVPMAEWRPGGKPYSSQDLLWLSDGFCEHTGLFWSLFSSVSSKCPGGYHGRIDSSLSSLMLSAYHWDPKVIGETLILPFLRKQLTSSEAGRWGNPRWALRLHSCSKLVPGPIHWCGLWNLLSPRAAWQGARCWVRIYRHGRASNHPWEHDTWCTKRSHFG